MRCCGKRSGPESLQNVSELEKAGIPCLFFNCTLPGAMNLDYQGMGYEAARLLIERDIRISPAFSRREAVQTLCLRAIENVSLTTSFPSGRNWFSTELPRLFFTVWQAMGLRLSSAPISPLLWSFMKRPDSPLQNAGGFLPFIPRDDGRLKTPFPDISSFAIPHRQFGRFLCEQLIRLTEREENDGAGVLTEATAFSWVPEPDSLSTIGLPFSMLPKKMAVVGSSNVDIYLKVDQLPSSGRVARTSLSAQHAGGKGLNQAVGAAKLGHRVSLITAVGNDTEADMLYETLSQTFRRVLRHPEK